MSQIQCRTGKSEVHHWKPGRSGSFCNNRGFYVGGEGRGSVGAVPHPALPSRAAPRPLCVSNELSTNGSFNNPVGEQEGKARMNLSNLNSAVNGACKTVNAHGPSDGGASKNEKPDSDKKISRAVPKAPATQFAAATPGGESAPFLQFGTISPSTVKGMQVPARTCSAPPNLDEQKSDQVCHDSLKVPALSTPSASKPLPPQKHQAPKQTDIRESDPPHAKQNAVNTPIPAVPSTPSTRPPVLFSSGMPIHIPFQQQQIPMQFTGPNMQMSSHATVPSSFQMTMALSGGIAPQVPQPMFIPSIQPLMHQVQNLGLAPQLGHQLPQLRSMGIDVAPQFTSQQPGKFVSQRKAVKVTHPETHEELKLDRSVSIADTGSFGQRQLPNATSQPSTFPSFNHQPNYYSTAYNHSQMYFPSASSLPLASTQMSTGPQMAQYNHPVNQIGNPISYTDPLAQVTVKPAPPLLSGKAEISSIRISMPVTKPKSSKLTKLPEEKGSEVAYQSTSLAQKQNVEAKSTDSVLNHKIFESQSSLCSTHSNESECSSLVHICVSETTATVVAEDNCRQAENLIIQELKQTDTIRHSVSNVSDRVKAEGDGLSSVEACHLDAPTFPNTVIDENLKSSNSFAVRCKTTEFEDNQGILSGSEYVRDDACDDVLSNSSSATFTSIGRSDKTKVVNMEVVADSSEKLEGFGLCISDHTGSSSEEGERCILTNIETMVASSTPTSTLSYSEGTEMAPYEHEDKISDPAIIKYEIVHSKDVTANGVCISPPEIPDMASFSLEIKSVKLCNGAQTPSVFPGPIRTSLEPKRTRNNKKKRKEIYSKADAAGSSDLYNAFKHPEEKRKATHTLETSTVKSFNESAVDLNGVVNERSKVEFEDWDAAADTSTSNLKTLENGKLDHTEKKIQVECRGETNGKKKYTRDFLLTFSEHCKDLPDGFEIKSDLSTIMSHSLGMKHGNGNSGRNIGSRPSGQSRGDRRMAAISDEDRWIKSNAFRTDQIHEIAVANFCPVQGVCTGVVRNPSMHSTDQFSGGSGPAHSLLFHGGISRNNSDYDRWQRATVTQKGLMPSPQGPMQIMHKSANRYEIGKVSDGEELKQRRIKAILNKLTPQNFEKLFAQVKVVNIDNAVALIGVISQIFDKALMEPTFCEMYADFCFRLASELPDFVEENENITFRRLLLNKCQEEFERDEREEAEADKADEDGEIRQAEEEREEKRIKVRRRMLGNIRLIGELYKKKMLTERIMHECLKKLLGQHQSPDEENIEALCKLMSTIGEMIDHLKAREHMDAYFEVMAKLSTDQKLSSRVRFLLKDTIDLRKNRWRQRMKIEGPKKIEDVHRDAAQERHAQTSKQGRNSSISSRRGPSVDHSHKGSIILSSTSSQSSGSIRGLLGHTRGSSRQSARLDERYQFENRVLSVPPPQRSTYNSSVTLGPQGGLAKGMSGRGSGLVANIPSVETSSRNDNSHSSSLNSNGGISVGTNNQTSRDYNSSIGIRGSHLSDRVPLRPFVDTSERRPTSSDGKINASSELKALSEDMLREKSISAIIEFYSAKDENEIVLCIKELNSPSFYSSMVALWVTDSFERKNLERTLLAQLLVNLTKGQHSLISQSQLIKGFESVLFSLEDAVNDAPRAAEFLGHIFGRLVVENAVHLMEIGKLILEGGEEPGNLVKAGLGSEIFRNILEFVQMVKGDSFLNDICSSSDLWLDDFKPPNRSSKQGKSNRFP